MQEEKTHFGFEEVKPQDKAKRVGEVFTKVANKYDIMNDAMSLGMHRLWKRTFLTLAKPKTGDICLDLAAGTGDITKLISKAIGDSGKVISSDINEAMLAEGRRKLLDQGIFNNVEFVAANAETLPFSSDKFDLITMAFGLRNVTDKGKALAEMYRTLKPGSAAFILEFSKPAFDWLEKLYDQYSFKIIPKLGEWLADDRDSYQYLVESIRMHPDQEALKELMIASGFDKVDYFNLTGGIVAIHRGYKW
jgi:demethylmenaquinone methyltransferase/2-methoxy-6-polyprenyl-1,4-benzoquinol methylase